MPNDTLLKENAARAGLAAAGCPGDCLTPERVQHVMSYLAVVTEQVPDPREDHKRETLPQVVVRVMDKAGNPRWNRVHHPHRPLTVEELVRELIAGEDRVAGKVGRHIGAGLRWRPFGA